MEEWRARVVKESEALVAGGIPAQIDDVEARLWKPGCPSVFYRFPETPAGLLMMQRLRKHYLVAWRASNRTHHVVC